MNFSIFEFIMLVAFGFSWPAAIYKTYKSKNPAGKSLFFATLVIIGYLAGVAHKIVYKWDWVAYLYILNTLMVLTDTVLVLYYRYWKKR